MGTNATEDHKPPVEIGKCFTMWSIVIHRINGSILPEFIFGSHVSSILRRKYAAALVLLTRG